MAPSGRRGRIYHLQVEFAPSVTVREDSAYARLLPVTCPERHINSDGTFCLGLGPVSSANFWAALRSYLVCQDYAASRRRWPPNRWLSHGVQAAELQLLAEAYAAEAGVGERYRRALEFRTGCLAGDLATPERGENDTPRRAALIGLIHSELARREAEESFTRSCHMWGRRCCRTMTRCPLGDLEDQNQSDTSEEELLWP